MEIAASAMLDGLKNNRIGKLALSRFLSQNNVFVTECTNNVILFYVVTYLYQEFRTITTEYLIEWSNSTFTLSQTLRWFPARGIKLNFASEGIIIFVSHGIPSISLSWLNVWINKTPGDPDAAERKMRNIYRGYILHIGCGERRSSRFGRVIFLDFIEKDCIDHVFVVNCLPLPLRSFEVFAVFSLIAVSLDGGRDFFREQQGGANVSKALAPRIDALQPQLRGGWGPDTRRKASVSDATSLRSDRSDLTRAPPSYARQAQQDARSSNSSRARSTVICVAYPAAGPCLRYGRTSDRGIIAQKRKRGFAASRLVPELAQTSLWPASQEYNRRCGKKKVERGWLLQIICYFFSGDVADIFRCGHKVLRVIHQYYFVSHLRFNNFPIVARSYLLKPKVIITIARELGDFRLSRKILDLAVLRRCTFRFRILFTRVFQDTFAPFLIIPSVLPDSQWSRNFSQPR
ncbi:hypothetical protein ALC60_06304 [Trachymyrmex zeteki]|uniref:Uncharacterized protein n=1 Tax=Mycetomoellerius zeteki TaxID=64791 RepID=A0A151X3J2_9HYME|nr:hypothetical protein ALC60_06304 [Trachymyrmex zeteki]